MNVYAIIPVYRHVRTVGAILDAMQSYGLPVILVDDGNPEDEARLLAADAGAREGVSIVRMARNSGKGAALQAGMRAAWQQGCTHALQIDADGQHDVADIGRFLELATQHPAALVYGVPVYDDSVPRARLYGRYLTHVWVWVETLSRQVRDSMCGFRVYPLQPTLALMARRDLPARMEFDVEVMVRLHWRGVRFVPVPTRVVYPPGGLSHFRMWRDNARITWMHTRLVVGMLVRAPMLLWRRAAGRGGGAAHWASISENTWTGGIQFLLFVHRWLGRWPFRVAVFPMVFGSWLVRAQARRASRDYLRAIETRLAAAGRKETYSSLRHMMRFAEALLDKLLAVGGRFPATRVRTENREEFYQALASGRGAVIVTAHVGCLELCQHMAGQRGQLDLNILTHTRHAEKFNRILRRLDPGSRARFIEVQDFGPALAMSLSERVAAGECVVVAGDRVPVAGEAMTRAPFLGREASFPIGPYMLASLFECPMFLLCCIREGESYTIRFEQLAERVLLPRGERQARLAAYASDYARRLEATLLRSPLDWFNFFDFWNQGHGQTTRA